MNKGKSFTNVNPRKFLAPAARKNENCIDFQINSFVFPTFSGDPNWLEIRRVELKMNIEGSKTLKRSVNHKKNNPKP